MRYCSSAWLLPIFAILNGWRAKEVCATTTPPTAITWYTVENSSEVRCTSLHEINKTELCNFVTTQEDCQIQGGFISYIRLPYCYLSGQVAPGIIIFALWLAFLFTNMGMTVEDFLCPSLNSISKLLRLSENVAGVTFLAVGNGAADIFSLIILMIKVDRDGSYAETAMGSILGGGLFVVTVVAGMICFSYKLKVVPAIFIRDVGFYLAAVIWLSVMIADGEILLGEAVGFVALYLIYVVCVLFCNQWEKRQQQNEERSPLLGRQESETSTSVETAFSADQEADSSVVDRERVASYDSGSMASVPGSIGVTSETKKKDAVISNFHLQWVDFWKAIWPYRKDELCQKKWYSVVLLIIEAPLRLFLTLTIPVVDYEKTPGRSWNRLLIMCNILLGPAFATFAFEGFFHRLYGHVYLGLIVFGVSVLVALAVALASYSDHPPPYQWAFAFLGFFMCIVWIYILANEVINVLEACGNILQITGAVLGLIVLAGGNSVCDLVANFVVARKGNPMTGFSASYGSPLLNVLLGVGIGSLVAIGLRGGSYKVELNRQLIVAIASLLFSLVASILLVLLLNFTVHRLLGVVLVASYVVFFIVLMAVEFS